MNVPPSESAAGIGSTFAPARLCCCGAAQIRTGGMAGGV
jgi:hypothetical protein